MKVPLSSLLLIALLVLPSALSAQFQFCSTDCRNICNSESLCNRGCTISCNTHSTCGEYGVCNPDPDGDSVIWNDNCPSTYNPNQADCDGDGRGTACDTDNGIWSQIGATSMCVIIGRTHVGYVDVQAHYEAEYQDVSACGSPNSWKRFAVPGTTCYGFISLSTCCDNTYGHPACFYYLNQDACHPS